MNNNFDNGFGNDFGENEIKLYSADPFAQILAKADPIKVNGGYKQAFGFAVTAENAEKVGFSVEENDYWELIEYPFQGSAETVALFLTSKPRILVLGQSRLYMRLRESEKIEYTPFNKDIYLENKKLYTLVTQYAIFFVNQNGMLMHDIPLKIRMKGVLGAQFSRFYGAPQFKPKREEKGQISFCDYLRNYAKYESPSPNLSTNANYYAQMSFEPIFKVERKGQGNSSVNLGCIAGWKERPKNGEDLGYRIVDPGQRMKVNELVGKILRKEDGWDMDAYFSRKKEQNQPNEMQPNTMIGVGAAYEYPAGYDDESFD